MNKDYIIVEINGVVQRIVYSGKILSYRELEAMCNKKST